MLRDDLQVLLAPQEREEDVRRVCGARARQKSSFGPQNVNMRQRDSDLQQRLFFSARGGLTIHV